MKSEYFLVTKIGPNVSIFRLDILKDELLLTEKVASCVARSNLPLQKRLRGVCLRGGKAGFLFDGGHIVVAGLVGVFPSIQKAIKCFVSPELELEDHRWCHTTDAMLAAIEKKKSPRII